MSGASGVRGWFPRELDRARAVRRVVGRPVLRTGVSTVSSLTFLYLFDVNQAFFWVDWLPFMGYACILYYFIPALVELTDFYMTLLGHLFIFFS